MKKLMAIALALVMMLAVMVPAFAVTETWEKYDEEGAITTTPDSQTLIKTSTQKLDDEGNPVDAAWFTVTIPAETTIYWGEESTELIYYIRSQLGPDTGVHVTVADKDNAYTMTDDDHPDLKGLPYTLAGQTDVTTADPVLPTGQYAVQVQVAENDWNAAVISEYADVLTFSAETADIA